MTALGERIARVEQQTAEIPIIRQRVHDMSTHVAVLIDAAERQEKQHAELMRAVRDMQTTFAAAIAQHDLRDDTRFRADDARLRPLEQWKTQADIDRNERDRRRNAMHPAWLAAIVSVTVAAAGVVEHLLLGAR